MTRHPDKLFSEKEKDEAMDWLRKHYSYGADNIEDRNIEELLLCPVSLVNDLKGLAEYRSKQSEPGKNMHDLLQLAVDTGLEPGVIYTKTSEGE